MKIIIFAGNHQQFLECCKERNLNPYTDRNIIEANTPEKIRGLHGKNIEIIYYGTYYYRKDSEEYYERFKDIRNGY